MIKNVVADPSNRAVQGVGLQQLDCWNHDFESHCRYGCSSFVLVLCWYVAASANS